MAWTGTDRHDVAALAESLGTAQTIAALPDYARDGTIASPASWWSGWGFDNTEGIKFCGECGTPLASGCRHCGGSARESAAAGR